MEDRLRQLIPSDLRAVLNVDAMSDMQEEALARWGLKMFSMGQAIIADIRDIKYDGHLIVLDDGSRWEVDDIDTTTASMWSMMDKVLLVPWICDF